MTSLQRDNTTNKFYELWVNEDGQDLIEYTIALTFLTVATAALLSAAGSSISTVWSAARTTVLNAATKAS